MSSPDFLLGELSEEAAAAAEDAAMDLAAEKAIAAMNTKHAVLFDHGKTIVITEAFDRVLQRHKLERSSFDDIRLWYCNETVVARTRSGRVSNRPLGEFWLSHPKRRQYDNIVFDPEKKHPTNIYNMWRGFAVEARRGSWSAFRDHLYAVGAAGNDEVFRYWEGWLARAVQKPGRPGEVAIALRGAQGAGKGIIARNIGHLFGQHFAHISRPKHLTHHFNAHLEDAVLVFADEAVWGGDRANEGALKALITEPVLPIERKGRDTVVVKNVIHLLLATNNDWAVPMGMDDRRFCVIDVLPTFVGNHAYFQKIQTEMQQGGYEAMLFDLLAYDLTNFNHRRAPLTDAGLDQKVQGLSPVRRWWLDKLKTGQIVPNIDWPRAGSLAIARNPVHEDYIRAMNRAGVDRRAMESELGAQLRKLVPGWDQPGVKVGMTKRVGDGREKQWLFPSLAECRKHFEALIKQPMRWDDDDAGPEQASLIEKVAA